jgi:hypothetical protein
MSIEAILLMWLVFAVIGGALGVKGGAQAVAGGVLVGLLLGPIGVLIMVIYALLGPSKESVELKRTRCCPHCAERIAKTAKRCKHCGGITEILSCPHCSALLIKPESPTGSLSSCPECREEFVLP